MAFVAALWSEHEHWGLLHYLDPGFGAAMVIGVLGLELTSYLLHRAMHGHPWLWRVHAVHHSDTSMDFSTTYRNHPLEILFAVCITGPVIAILGPPAAAVALYQLLRVTVNIFAHANLYVPPAIEARLRYLLVTPDFHRLHHSSDRRFTDSNYCVVFPWYDYLFGTASWKPFEEHRTMEIGLEYSREPEASRLDRLLWMPFRRRTDTGVAGAREGGPA